MRRRRAFILLVLALLVVAAVFLTRRTDTEPRYKGKNLSTWLLVYQKAHMQDPDNPGESQAAIKAIGTL